eukprot:gene13074-15382_t
MKGNGTLIIVVAVGSFDKNRIKFVDDVASQPSSKY